MDGTLKLQKLYVQMEFSQGFHIGYRSRNGGNCSSLRVLKLLFLSKFTTHWSHFLVGYTEYCSLSVEISILNGWLEKNIM